ncbi:hypothetical protein EYV94_27625 [Puteibacter caeruleilacunae]|nr:hypothetical protein EYV94_27625 [Puteibacter caeruleilacunae]
MIKAKYILISVGLLLLSQYSFAQDLLLRRVSFKTGAYNYSIYVPYNQQTPKISNRCVYYWYEQGKIHQNQGGFSGLLLEGSFEKCTLTGFLIEKGEFKGGLKNGEWKKWDLKGNLIYSEYWKDGYREGPSWEYDATNKKVTTCNYKNSMLHGEYKIMVGDSLVKSLKYNKGRLIVKKPKVKKQRFEKPEKKLLKKTLAKTGKSSGKESVEMSMEEPVENSEVEAAKKSKKKSQRKSRRKIKQEKTEANKDVCTEESVETKN